MSIDDFTVRLRAALAQRHDVELALLFGSHARGTQRLDSDVDVAVQGAGLDCLGLSAELTVLLDREVDVIALHEVGYPLLQELVRDGVVVHEGHSGSAAQWWSHALTSLETDRPWYERMRRAWLQRVAERGV